MEKQNYNPETLRVPNSPETKSPATQKEKAEKEPLEKCKEKFLNEEINPYANRYDYNKFSDNDFAEGLQKIKKSYQEGNNTYNIDINSFSNEELAMLWKNVDSHLYKCLEERDKNVTMEEAEKISSDKWGYLPDGRLGARAKNPCVTGGVHGDETTLPEDMGKVLESQRVPLISVDQQKGYSNWKVNSRAYDEGVRAFSVSKGIPDENSDMNRPNIDDIVTKEAKEAVIGKIALLPEPFLLDCHNDNSLDGEKNPEKKLPYANITDAGDVNHKINLAAELGLHRVIIFPQAMADGSMVESLRNINKQSDGMIVEVPGNDTNGTSAKIASRFLQISEGLKQNRPSSGIQILHEFQTKFLPPNPDIKIFKVELISKDQLGADPSAYYKVLNDKPVKITLLQIKNDKMEQIPMPENDKKLLE